MRLGGIGGQVIPPSVEPGRSATACAPATLTAWIPLEAPSMNSLLNVIWHQRRMVAKPEVRLFRSQLKSYLPKWCLAGTGPYSLSLSFYDNWYTKDGYPKRKDVPNLIKSCVDAIAERYGFDDSLLWEVKCLKVNTDVSVGIGMELKEYVHVE